MNIKLIHTILCSSLFILPACAPDQPQSNPDLPPHPGEPGKLTITGVDSDRDGVRDDIQIFIHKNNGDKPTLIAPLLHFAKYRQNAMQDYLDDGVLDRDYLNDHLRMRECIKLLDREFYKKRLSSLEQVTMNTAERWTTNLRLDAALASGKEITLPEISLSDCSDIRTNPTPAQ